MYSIRVILVSLVVSGTACAADCDITALQIFGETVEVDPAVTASRAAATEAATEEKLTALPTATSLAGADIGGSVLNFLPLLSISGLSGNLEGDSESGDNDNVGFDFNLPLPLSSKGGRQLKLSATFNRQPVAFDPMLESLPPDQRDAARTSLERDLDLADDATFGFTYNVNNDTLGRYRGMVGELVGRIVTSVDARELQGALRVVDDAMQGAGDLTKKLDEVDFTVNGAALDGEPLKEKQRALCEAWLAYDEVHQRINRAEDVALSSANIDLIARLASNQPQLHAAVAFRERNLIVGPDEVSASITFEWGYRANLNSLERFYRSTCAEADDADCIAGSWAAFVAQHRDAIEASDRLTFSLEYVDVADYEFSSNDGAVIDFRRGGSNKLVGRAGYGRMLGGSLMEGSRLDLALKYEDVSDDAALNDRAVGVLTITQKFGEMTVPFSIVYSNKPEFIEAHSDKQFSAHIGIKYEFQTL